MRWLTFGIGLLWILFGNAARSEDDVIRYEILAQLTGVPTVEGTLVRKMMPPISFVMGQEGGKASKYAQDLAFFRSLDGEIEVFLQGTLQQGFSTDPYQRSIQVAVVFPDAKKDGDEAWLDKMFDVGDAADPTASNDAGLAACGNLIQNFPDLARKSDQTSDRLEVVMKSTEGVSLTVKGIGYAEEEAVRCLYRHVFAALGIRGTVPAGYDSILSEKNPSVRPTAFDHWLVETLYRPEVSAGQPIEAAFPQLNGVGP